MAITKEINVVVKETGLDKVQKDVNKLDSSLENLSDTQQGLAKSMQSSSNSVLENGGAMGLLNDATGGLAMTVKDAVEASVLFTKSQKAAAMGQAFYTTVVGTSTGAMKLFRIALASTGIGAIVVGIGLLIANFDKVKKVVMNLIPGLALVGKIFDSLVEAVTDFVGLTSDASRELDRLGTQADATLAKNKFALEAYGDTYDQYTKRKIDANSKYAQHVKDINENETLSEEQKLKRLKILRETADREIAKADADRQSEKDKKAKEAKDKLIEAQKQEAEKAKQEAQKRKEEEEKALQEKIKKDAQKAYDLNEQLKQDVADVTAYQNEKKEEQTEKEEQEGINKIARIQGEYDQEIAIEQEASRQKQVIADANYNIASKTIDLLGQLAGKNKALQKAGIIASAGLGIYSVIKDTQAANMAAIAPPPLGLGPIAGIALQTKNTIQGALSIGAITAASAKALAAVGGGGSVSNGGSGGAPTQSAPSFNLVQGTSSNQIASSIGKQQPIEAFVVGRNVTSSQERDRNIIKSASL
jgi:hypothetical protein